MNMNINCALYQRVERGLNVNKFMVVLFNAPFVVQKRYTCTTHINSHNDYGKDNDLPPYNKDQRQDKT